MSYLTDRAAHRKVVADRKKARKDKNARIEKVRSQNAEKGKTENTNLVGHA